MGNFIAKATLRVVKQNIHTSTNIALQQIGCNLYGEYNEDSPYFYLHEGDYCVSPCRLDIVGDIDYIDCNHYTNGDEDLAVKLFLALAEMQRFKDTNQWFKRITVDGIEYVKHSQKLICKIGVRAFDRDCFPLTPLELAEAVKDGRIKL